MKSWRWGILGTGRIAGKFTSDLAHAAGAVPYAVASRALDKAQSFADEYAVERAYGSYEELVNDPRVDVVYVSSPHALHEEHASLALRAGKAVLCEKPLTLHATQAERLVALARERDCFLAEGMWMRCMPAVRCVIQWLEEGAIGDVRRLEAAFEFTAAYDSRSRLWDPALGGGALLDVGVYPVALAVLLLGSSPTHIEAKAGLCPKGLVDGHDDMVLRYANGATAQLACAIDRSSERDALVEGTQGRIVIHFPMAHPQRVTLERVGEEPVEFEETSPGVGLHYEASAVMRALDAGLSFCPEMPMEATLACQRIMDEVLRQAGVSYAEPED